ncbi:hypothetical protein AB0K18_30680 [Nonomuraea sp. NPDC049421]|uniref:hypothetical protein n=1 Tax=Nonomuraea sp. NPDC049421 TaxID=3155275 RepID=UPI003437E03F
MTSPLQDLPDRAVSSLFNTEDVALVLVDHQPQMIFGARSADPQSLVNNVSALAKLGKLFNPPTVSSTAAHDAAIVRMSQRGIVPVSTASVLSELQRDWARGETYDAVNEIVADHMGAWGQGVNYVNAGFSKK